MSTTHLKFLFFVVIQIFFFSKFGSNPQIQYPCKPPNHNYQFCNTKLSINTRAHSLISHLTLEEKIQQLCNNATSIPRLGIPSYEWWSESLHGIATNGPGVSFNGSIRSATNFPQVIVTASAFNRSLWFQIAKAVAVEARAMYNVGQAGLTFWAPNINVFRDPRWGRGAETTGEDPMVASIYAVEYVRGFQGQNLKTENGFREKGILRNFVVDDDDGDDNDDDGDDINDGLMLSACCKHFTAYDLESWGSFSRYNFNAVVTKQDMEDTYQPPFRSCIEEGKASCLMCSYNSVNGIPACADRDLLAKACNQWGFKGYITSDCDAVATVYEYQHYIKSPEDAVADVLKAGVDINCGTYLLRNTQTAIDQGKVREEDIDRALINLFLVQLRLGLFDGDPTKGKFGKLGPQDVCTSKNKNLALEAAKQGIVLLKNDVNFLPFNKNGVSSFAIIGPMANDASKLGGGYSGIPCNPRNLVEELRAYAKKTLYATGCLDVSCNSDVGFDEAFLIAKEVDYVIVVAGLDLSQETEDHDRTSLLLPGKQMELVSTIAAASRRPVVLVLTGGGPLDVSFAKDDPRIASIIWIGYPGEAGGKALAEVIFGDFNPAGRLPMTWHLESFTSVPMNDMNMRADPSRGYPGRTYRFYTGEKVYAFGEGLSYTNFTYKLLSAPRKISISGSNNVFTYKNILHQKKYSLNHIHINEISCNLLNFFVRISVMNTGGIDGSHVIMLFAKVPKIIESAPEKQLVGFNRVHTASYGSTETSILVDPCKHLSITNQQGERILPLGNHILILGDLEHSILIHA